METAVSEEPTVNIETEALTTVKAAKLIVVTNEEQNAFASDTIRAISSLDKQAEAFFKPMKQKLDEAKKEILDKEKSVRTPLAEAKQYLSTQIGSYLAREEHKRREEEQRLRLIAQVEADAHAKAEAEELALQRALEAEQNGNQEEAAAILSAPVHVAPVVAPAIIVPSAVAKQAGIASRKTWKFRVVNETLIPREYLSVDEQKIGQVVRALKENCKISGIEVYSVDGIAVR